MANNQTLEAVEGFKTFAEYEKFLLRLDEVLSIGLIFSIKKQQSLYTPFYGAEERWFSTKSGIVWLLIPPDYPFEGFFKPITEVK